MASKNLMWLSSFFALLFITFCVTRHLDDLNPHITNVAYSDTNNLELPNLSVADTTPALPTHVEDPLVLLAEKISAQRPIETIKEKTDVYTSDDLQETLLPIRVASTLKKVQATKKHTVHKVKAQPTVKNQKLHKKVSMKKRVHVTSKKKNPPQGHTVNLGNMIVDESLIQRLYTSKEIAPLNKLAYIQNINKGSIVVITTHNQQAGKKLYRYLRKHHIAKKDIIMTQGHAQDNLIKITLKGRH